MRYNTRKNRSRGNKNIGLVGPGSGFDGTRKSFETLNKDLSCRVQIGRSKIDPDQGALAQNALDPDLRFMELHKFLHERKPQPETRDISMKFFIDLIKGLEDPLLLLRRDPNPVVRKCHKLFPEC